MPGGLIKGAYWSPPHPVYVDRAEGCYFWDLDGREYVDFANHHTAMILGHSHPDVVEAVQNEVKRGFGLGGPTTLEAEMAEELAKRFPSIDEVRFTNSGTESSLHATRLVRKVTGKQKIAKFEGAYHGSHDAVEISVTPAEERAGAADSPVPVAGQQGMAEGSEDNIVMLPYSQPETVELILREHQDELAGVFYDGKPGMLDISREFTRFVREITQELGLPMIMDEVVSYRVGYGGYQALCDVEPDLTIFGKIVGGGLPVGAIGGKSELMDVLDNTGSPTGLGQSGTFSGNNFTLAAGLATLRALTPEVYEYLDRLRTRLQGGLREAFDSAGIPCQIVGEGSLVNTYLTDRPVRDYRSSLTADKELGDRIGLALFLDGYHARGGMGLVLSSPMENEHVDGLVESLERVLADED
jgi:glutamate-1-semialdehyde 2,1-aminomutase